MMRTKFLKAARDKKQPVEKPKAKRKVNSNIGKAGPSGEDAHKTTSWSPEEEMALRTIQSYVTLDKEAWRVQKWLESGTTTDELRELYSKLKNGRLNKNRTLREDSAMISKFNRMKHWFISKFKFWRFKLGIQISFAPMKINVFHSHFSSDQTKIWQFYSVFINAKQFLHLFSLIFYIKLKVYKHLYNFLKNRIDELSCGFKQLANWLRQCSL